MTLDKPTARGLLRITPRQEQPATVAWEYLPTRRQAACGAAILGLLSVTPKLYFWTVTFPTVQQDEVAGATMHRFWQRWMRSLGSCSAVRVAEIHPGGHGLHFHLVVNRRYPAGAVWRIARACGAGRIDVQPIVNYAQAIYAAKYLGKDTLPIFGVNRYGRTGHGFGQIRNMQCDSKATELWKAAWRQARGTADPRTSALAFVRTMATA